MRRHGVEAPCPAGASSARRFGAALVVIGVGVVGCLGGAGREGLERPAGLVLRPVDRVRAGDVQFYKIYPDGVRFFMALAGDYPVASPDGRWLVLEVVEGAGCRMVVLEWPSLRVRWVIPRCGPVGFTPDGRSIVAPARGKGYGRYDLRSGRIRTRFPDDCAPQWYRPLGVGAGSFTCQVELASGNPRWVVRQWDIRTGRRLHELGLPYRTHCVEAYPDGDGYYLAVLHGTEGDEECFERSIDIWVLPTGRKVCEVPIGRFAYRWTNLSWGPGGLYTYVLDRRPAVGVVAVGEAADGGVCELRRAYPASGSEVFPSALFVSADVRVFEVLCPSNPPSVVCLRVEGPRVWEFQSRPAEVDEGLYLSIDVIGVFPVGSGGYPKVLYFDTGQTAD